jgi:hypothetical protein
VGGLLKVKGNGICNACNFSEVLSTGGLRLTRVEIQFVGKMGALAYVLAGTVTFEEVVIKNQKQQLVILEKDILVFSGYSLL